MFAELLTCKTAAMSKMVFPSSSCGQSSIREGEERGQRKPAHAPLSGSLSGPQPLTRGQKVAGDQTKTREREREKGQSHKRKARRNLKTAWRQSYPKLRHGRAQPSRSASSHMCTESPTRKSFTALTCLGKGKKKKKGTHTYMCVCI